MLSLDYERSIDNDPFRGYFKKPIPDDLDDDVAELVTYITALPRDQVLFTVERMSVSCQNVCREYGHRMALRAIRTGRPVYLELSVVAVAVGGLIIGEREPYMTMAVVEDVANKLGISGDTLVDVVEKQLGAAGSKAVGNWFNRPPESRSLQSMKIVATDGPDGVSYSSIW